MYVVTSSPRSSFVPGSPALWAPRRPACQVSIPSWNWAGQRPARLLPRGMGALTGQTASIAQAAAAGASTTVATLVALGTIGGPVGIAISGLIAVGSALANAFSGCGQTCVAATNIANQVEQILQQNLNSYMSAPVHYASAQSAAMNNFMTAWNAIQQACSNPQLGAAGQRCISDRAQGSCAYKVSDGGWMQDANGWTFQPYGANNSGSTCWNWFVGYYDPIANDPTVVPDPSPLTSAGSAVGSALSSVLPGSIAGIPLADLALPALLLIAALVLL